MSLFDIFILAIALSIDATVVSFSNGLIFTKNRTANSLLLAFSGFFHVLSFENFFGPVWSTPCKGKIFGL